MMILESGLEDGIVCQWSVVQPAMSLIAFVSAAWVSAVLKPPGTRVM